MVKGNEILRVIEEIRNVSSTKAKQAILEENKDVPYLKEVLYYALSPRKKFYIKSINLDNHSNTPTKGVEDILITLDELATGKVRGHEATTLLLELNTKLDHENIELLRRIIAKKLKFSMGTTLINKVYPKLIEDTPYMGCKSFSKKYADALFQKTNSVISEVKMDGQYINATISNNESTFESRQGEENVFPGATFEEELNVIDGSYVFNGELTIRGEEDRHIANGIIRSLVDYYSKMESRNEKENDSKLKKFIKERGASPDTFLDRIVFTVWDVITIDEYISGESSTPRGERLALVELLVGGMTNVKVIEYRMVNTLAEALDHYNEITQSGGEGTVIKDFNGYWKDGKPTYQLKVKTEMTFDLEIIGFNYGTGKNEGIISSLQVTSSDGKLNTNPGGMPEDLMDEITADPDKYLGKIVEVKCYGVSNNSKGEFSVAHPSVLFIREDKNKANSLDECMEIMKIIIDGGV